MTEDSKQVAAVYTGWTTFKNSLEQLSQGVPNLIDKSVFQGQSWGVKAQLVTAYKFLGLTEEDGKPTPVLLTLAQVGEEERKQILTAVFRERYSKLFELDLSKATPAQLDQSMGAHYGVGGDTRYKAIRFFLSAAVYLGIPLSPQLKPKGSANGGAPRKRGSRRKKVAPVDAPPPTNTPAPAPAGASRVFKLRTAGAELTLSASLDFLTLNSEDRKFFFELIERIENYEQGIDVG